MVGDSTSRTYSFRGVDVTLHQPMLVARSKGYLWFPTLARMNDGSLRASMTDYADDHLANSTGQYAWSRDAGRTWSQPIQMRYGDVDVRLPNGDAVIQPYYLYPIKEQPLTIGSPYNFAPHDRHELRETTPGITVTGFPRPDVRLKNGAAGFVFNGQSVTVEGGYLATIYGTFEGDTRFSLLAVHSSDAIHWRVRSTISDAKCPLECSEGPCEAALCRLKDGRLMCVYRLGTFYPFGRQFSADDGRTWTPPQTIPAFSVQPSLVTMKDGTVALSGGRQGIYLWLNLAGDGEKWVRVNIEDHHNLFNEAESFWRPGISSCYTEVVALDESNLMMIYDRIPFGWAAIPPEAHDTNSVWVVRATIRRT